MRTTTSIILASLMLSACNNSERDVIYPEPPVALVVKPDDFPLGSEGQSAQNAQIKTVERALLTRLPKAHWDRTFLVTPANRSALAAHYETELANAGWEKMPPFEGLSAQYPGELNAWQKNRQMFALYLWSPYGTKGSYVFAEVFSNNVAATP